MTENSAHVQGTCALINVAKAGIAALKVAVRSIETDPKTAHKGIALQATLISKAVSSLASKMDGLPPYMQPADDGADTASAVDIGQVAEGLTRLKRASEGHFCPECSLVLPSDH